MPIKNFCGGDHCSGFWNIPCDDILHPTCDEIGQVCSEMGSFREKEPEKMKYFLENIGKNYIILLKEQLKIDSDLRNKIKICPVCGHNIADRTVTLYRELIEALYEVYKWCGKNKQHEFSTKEIRHLLSRNNYARFGDLIRFGGIVYKPKNEAGESHKAQFGINMARAKEFFAGAREIPVQITLNQITNEIIDAHYVKINNFPKLNELLTKEGLYEYDKQLPTKLF